MLFKILASYVQISQVLEVYSDHISAPFLFVGLFLMMVGNQAVSDFARNNMGLLKLNGLKESIRKLLFELMYLI